MGNSFNRPNPKVDKRFELFELQQKFDKIQRDREYLKKTINLFRDRASFYGLRINKEARRSLAKIRKYEARLQLLDLKKKKLQAVMRIKKLEMVKLMQETNNNSNKPMELKK